ncbi:hypothetical protein PRUPE_8G075900 [Prunus persica]|uniref:Uncharacterized protein n=1 Tax=Prunus persica TaxID=3760 RepID=A0A251MUP8_PRUPE|nr:UPF0481 protein At3g47200 [Prunus persica]ONH90812.1 hypothetical protein PRUPE_8G075900 [Prunus persica]
MAQKDENVRQVNKRGGGQGSRGDQDQPAEIEVSITIHEEASTREERLNKLREEAPPIQAEKVKPKIQRVPFMLRQDTKFDKYYEPIVAALGPFHHTRKPKYEHAEKIKLKLAANFVKDSKQNDADLLKKVEDNINELRKCYDEEATKDYEDEFLAWMLFVDGCSTLEFIYKYDELENFQIKRDQVTFVEHDIFLLENQLPYQLLQLLMSSSQIHKKLKKSIDDFVWRNSLAQNQQNPEAKPTHLLELLRTTMLGTSPSEKTKGTKLPHSFRNVQELQAAGIHFRPSNSNSLRSISFISSLCHGILYLPQIKVDDSTRPKFMNLIAYEMCPDFHNDFGVTSYICFLDSLIDHPDDVKHLRKKLILQNFLGNDEEVAQLFNEIGTDLVPNDDIYYSVKDQIEKHYGNWGNRVMAQFFHEHFSSPWTVVAFLGALLALGSSIVQTVYSVLGYHNNK